MSVCLVWSFLPLSVHLSACPPMYVSVHSSVQSFIHLFVCLDGQSIACLLFVCLLIPLFVYFFVCLFVCRSVRLFVRSFVAGASKTGGLYLSLRALLLNNGYIFHESMDMCTL